MQRLNILINFIHVLYVYHCIKVYLGYLKRNEQPMLAF